MDLLAYAQAESIPVDATPKAPYSVDENLYHTSYEAGMLEDPLVRPLPEMFKMTCSPEEATDISATIQLHFVQGVPTRVVHSEAKVDESNPLQLFLYLNKLGGMHGIGRIDIVENRFVGIKSRGVYETVCGYKFLNIICSKMKGG